MTLKQYKRNEANNYHSRNALALATMYGTADEVIEVAEIVKLINKRGYSSMDESRRLFDLTNKHYCKLV